MSYRPSPPVPYPPKHAARVFPMQMAHGPVWAYTYQTTFYSVGLFSGFETFEAARGDLVASLRRHGRYLEVAEVVQVCEPVV